MAPTAEGESRWWLNSAEAAREEAPGSFFIPPAEKRRNLAPGDRVKLLFAFDPPAAGFHVERMWVEVEHGEGGRYRGRLLNEPSYLKGLACGDTVEFGPEHVAAYAWDPEELGYDPAAKAWVPRAAVAVGSERPPRVTMRPPELRAAGGDSGWILWSGDERREDVTNAERFCWSELGWLTDLFPELESVFRAGGGDWQWDAAADEYTPTG